MIDTLLVHRVDRSHPRGHDGGSGKGDTHYASRDKPAPAGQSQGFMR